MQTDEVIVSVLKWTRKNRQYVFTEHEFARIICMPDELEKAPAIIGRLAGIGFIDNIEDAAIVVNDRAGAGVQELIAQKLRPYDLVLVSGPSAASAHDLISQIPAALTCVTTGAPGAYGTRYGAITFEHTDLPEDVLLKDATPYTSDSLLKMTSETLTFELLDDAYKELVAEHFDSDR